ncbi:hypothetical protein CerSpe_289570 [Prunus speciosa]
MSRIPKRGILSTFRSAQAGGRALTWFLSCKLVQLILARLVQGFDMSRVCGEAVDMREGLGLAQPKANSLEALLSP